MLTCESAERLIARDVDDVLSGDERLALEAHVESCAGCAAAVRAQREVAAVLRSRSMEAANVDLVSRVSARLDEEAGVFGLANWRAWTLGLAPVTAALMLAAYLGLGASSTSAVQPSVSQQEVWPSTAATSVLTQPAASGDALVEAVLTGVPISAEESRDVR